jgi:ABC-type antimicrobial peptide transport system permease subunit
MLFVKAMIQNYLKIAWRNLLKNKMYGLINMGGLAMGMAVAMLMGLWVYDEVSYNRSHESYEHIAQVYRRNTEPLEQKTDSYFGMPQPVARVLAQKYGHLFKHVILLWWDASYTLRVGENSFAKTGQFIEDGVIDMFSLKMINGNAESLKDPRAIIVSESTAKSLFGDKDPINQSVSVNNNLGVTVTGVYADIASNSIFSQIQFFGNLDGLKVTNENLKANENNWGNAGCRIFVQTADHVSIEQANAAIADLYLKDTPEDVALHSKKYNTTLWLHHMKDWYLKTELKDGKPAGGRITFVWLFAIIGVFVLFLACINFVNLSTARNEKKAKEVGIRKAIGSMRSQLVSQFLSEAFLVVFLALVIALILVTVTLSPFNALAEKSISLPYKNIYFWIAIFIFLTVTVFLSGLYPAFYLSSFRPVKALKGSPRLGKSTALSRRILVVTQVTVSIVLIIGTIVVYQQIQYAQDRPVGYEREGLVQISNDADFEKNKWVMKDELLAAGAAEHVGFSSSPVTAIWDNWGGFTWKGKNPDAESNFTVTFVDEDYGKTIQWNLLQGRDFSRDFGTDRDAVIINKAAANYLGLENPVGEFITQRSNNRQRQIIGVVDDVVMASPYEPVRPGFYWLDKNNLGQMLIKLPPGVSVGDALEKIKSIQSELAPSSPFVYSFVDKEYDKKFKSEQRIGKLALVFAIMAIFLSCLGLFGLASFVAEQKTKEIGVRKVVGASIFNIWSLLSKEFIALVLISFVLAIPVAYYYLNRWLSTYTYHTDINPLVFIYAAGGVLVITLLTVSFHSIKAAIANPVKSLRSE